MSGYTYSLNTNQPKLIFNHSGQMGDILYSLYFVKEYAARCGVALADVVFNIQLDVRVDLSVPHPNGNVLMSQKAVDYLKPLLERFGFRAVTASPTVPAGAFDLSRFRAMKINYAAGDIRSYYYQLTGYHLPQDFSQPLFMGQAQESALTGKVIITYTSRYVNPLVDLKALTPFQERFVFLGLDGEYQQFRKDYFDLPYLKTENALEAAHAMLAAKGFLGNQSGMYTLAECLKIPRILVSPEICQINGSLAYGPVNNLPIGGWFEVVRINEKLLPAVRELLADAADAAGTFSFTVKKR